MAVAFLVGSTVFQPTALCARWIYWQAGHRSDSGKTVISVEGSPVSNGLPQIYHFNRIRFEASATWREGDVLEVPQGEQQCLIYTLESDSNSDLNIDIRLSHELGFHPVEYVDNQTDPVVAQIFIGDYDDGASEVKAGKVSFQMKLLRAGNELQCVDQKGGTDIGSGMTFSEPPAYAWTDPSVPMKVTIEGLSARGVPRAENAGTSHMCCTLYDNNSPSWDQLELTISDNSGTGTIKKGTRIRILFSGGPSSRSLHIIPATSDPVPPIVMMDTDTPLFFHTTGLQFADDEAQCESGSIGSALISDYHSMHDCGEAAETKIDFGFRPDRPGPSRGSLNLSLSSSGFENLQPIAVFNFHEYTTVPLPDLMESAWARVPVHDPWLLPPGRPHWESSIALCDKSDPGDEGLAFRVKEGTFLARHLNERRIVFGNLVSTGNLSRPAQWRQRDSEPAIVSELPGGLEGANDNLRPDVVGFTIEEGGNRPYAWTAIENGWKPHKLPVEPFTINGKALDMNDRGEACGFVDVLVSKTTNRLPCFWQPEAGQYEAVVILPVPDSTISASALAMNNRGAIVGYYKTVEGTTRACKWEPSDRGHTFVDLQTSGVARGINAIGHIVGGSDRSSYIWQCGERHDLSAVNGFSESGALRVLAIGYLGDILATGVDGQKQLLTPVTALGFLP
ncbi:MAG: hypothetical protein KDN22_32140 [Verrucomicrobiae bacterium]|nr:hypothetical protein [Verrucomicrobiae bacterium]